MNTAVEQKNDLKNDYGVSLSQHLVGEGNLTIQPHKLIYEGEDPSDLHLISSKIHHKQN